MRNLNDIFNIDTSNNVSSQLEIAVESLMDGDSEPAYEHLTNLLYDELSEIPIYEGPSMNLYRFARLVVLNKGTDNECKPITNDIKNNYLTFGNPKNFNDPMDPILREWLNLRKKRSRSSRDKQLFKLLNNCIDNLRICCLSKKDSKSDDVFLNPLMWSHYADSHKGICIQYEITKDTLEAHNNDEHILRIGSVKYRNRKAMSDYITLDNALLAKGECWSYEREERLIYYCKNNIKTTRQENKQNNGYISLRGFKITAIFLGYRISADDKREVIEAVKERNIDLYQVGFDENDITKLKATKL